jgi:hypothetical protein
MLPIYQAMRFLGLTGQAKPRTPQSKVDEVIDEAHLFVWTSGCVVLVMGESSREDCST